MTPTNNEQDTIRSLGRIEGKLEGIELTLTEIHALTARVTKLESFNSKLYGALTIIGLLWSATVALILKTIK